MAIYNNENDCPNYIVCQLLKEPLIDYQRYLKFCQIDEILTNVVMLHLAQKLGYKNVYKTSVLFWDELSDVIYRKGNRTDGL